MTKGWSCDFIKANKKDFISFKASILLGEGENDPLQKAKLIKEIIQTVSLIPDHITRSVYAKELSTQFEMDENMVSNELIRLRKNSLANELNEPMIRDFKVANDNVSILPTQPKEELTYEFELIRIMLQFGTNEIETIQGDAVSPEKVSVVEMICQELTNDELSFRHPLCHKIHTFFATVSYRENRCRLRCLPFFCFWTWLFLLLTA